MMRSATTGAPLLRSTCRAASMVYRRRVTGCPPRWAGRTSVGLEWVAVAGGPQERQRVAELAAHRHPPGRAGCGLPGELDDPPEPPPGPPAVGVHGADVWSL